MALAQSPQSWRSWNKTRAVVLGIVPAAVVAVEFFTGAIGIVDKVRDWVVPSPIPSVRLAVVELDAGNECLEFAFSNLPKTFALGEVQLDVVGANGPVPMAGDMSARILEVFVNKELPPTVLSLNAEPIEFRAGFQADRDGDHAYVEFCPILNAPGVAGEIEVVPSFFSPDGTPIDNISVTWPDGSSSDQGLKIDISRPKNVLVSPDEQGTRLIPLHKREPAALHVLTAGVRAETSYDLAPVVSTAPAPQSTIVFWSDAIGIGASRFALEPSDYAAIARLMEAALLHAGSSPDQVSLDRLSAADVAAMRDMIGFPHDGDLLIYLLNRSPSLRDVFRPRESYDVTRYIHEDSHEIIESASRPYLGVSDPVQFDDNTLLGSIYNGVTAMGGTRLDPEEDPVSVGPGENSKTRQFQLNTLPKLVLAAKAFRAATRAPENEVVYPLLIAAQAVRRAFSVFPEDYRLTVYATELRIAAALRAYKGEDAYIRNEARRSGLRVGHAALVARLFENASEAFGSADVLDPHGRVGAAWGEAISRFALGADAERAFETAATVVATANRVEDAVLLGLFLEYLPSDEWAQVGDVRAWQRLVSEVVDANREHADRIRETVEDDFTRLMASIGRPDIAIPFLMDGIGLASGTDRETDLLRRLGAFTRNNYSLLSFQLEDGGAWEVRSREGYSPLLDFADYGIGQEPDDNSRRLAYSATTPEEDRVATISSYLFSTGAVEKWVDSSKSRDGLEASIVPYLKLVWVDWFALAFQPLRSPNSEAKEFRYRAMEASRLAARERVRELLQHRAATRQQKYLIDVFLRIREFLETSY